jgi:phage baseplate assembly protein W
VYTLRSADSSENLKYLGDTLLIPLDNQNSLEGLIASEVQTYYDKLLGEDIALFDTDTTVLSEGNQGEMSSNNQGDIKTVKGIANLKQALIMRLSTPLGGLLHHPTYGTSLHDLLGKRGSFETQQKMKVELERTLRGDTRVKDIFINSFIVDGDVLTVDVQIQILGIDDIINMGFSLDSQGVIEWA